MSRLVVEKGLSPSPLPSPARGEGCVLGRWRAAIFALGLLSLLLPGRAMAAFTVSLPANSAVTMGDASGILSFTVTNVDENPPIDTVRFYVPSALYYVEWTSPAQGWIFSAYGFSGANYWIEFTTTSNNINSGSSLVFNLNMEGPGWGNLVRDTVDRTDSLVQARAWRTNNVEATFSGALPSWARKALKLQPVATPSLVGIGNTVTLEMLVENRATAAKNGITATPSPPTATGASFTNTGGPTYNPNPLNLPAGAQGTITYTYFPTSTGQGYFTASVRDSLGTSTSRIENSNVVTIADFTTTLSFSPLEVSPGDNVTVTMTVRNNGITTTLNGGISPTDTTITVLSTAGFPTTGTLIIDSEEMAYAGTTGTTFTSVTRGVNGTTAASHSSGATVRSKAALGNITPTLTHIGTANANCTGPTPATLVSLAFGATGTFQWTCTMNGAVGQTIQFQGSASATSPAAITSNTATSELGALVSYDVVLTPDSVTSGSANVTFSFSVTNRGGGQIQCINFYHPPSGFTYSSANNTCGMANAAIGGGRRFSGGTFNNNTTCTFNVTYSSVPTVNQDTSYSWFIDLYRTAGGGGCSNYQWTLSPAVIVTANRLTLTNAPGGPLPADGTSQYTITATLTTAAGAPISGKTITFASTAGTLSSATAVTNGSGQAIVLLTAPVSSTAVTAGVTGTYINTDATINVLFSGVTGPNVQYVGGTLNPMAVSKGAGCSRTFSLNVTNVGAAGMSLTTASCFRFTDGTNTFIAYLDSASTVNAGSAATLSFGSTTSAGGGGGVPLTTFTDGSYTPMLKLTSVGDTFCTDGTPDSTTPPYKQTRGVSDLVTVTTGACTTGPVRILDWREVVK